MSDYYRSRVLRIPIDFEIIKTKYGIKNYYEVDKLEKIKNGELFGYEGKFDVQCDFYGNEDYYLDYKISRELSDISGDLGRVRFLNQTEQEKFKPLFEEVIENVDMTKVKYVDFVWYNGVDMPVYYDEKEIDDFYDEL